MFEVSDEEIILAKIISLIDKFNIHYINRKDLYFLIQSLNEDKKSFLEKDPSAKKDSIYFLLTFSSFYSVIGYRLANLILNKYKNNIDAKKISEYIKIKTGIEIHPSAKIGARFIIDHGIGTVIGETCIIGNDCYILQKVILGSSKIARNIDNQRHPIIGNNVEIGGFVRVLGNVKIGDNVKISPHSIIFNDIPSNSSVVIKNNKQYIKVNS